MTPESENTKRYSLWSALAVYIAIRGLLMMIAYMAPQDRQRAGAPNWWPEPPTIRWDAGHYWGILDQGYPRVNGQLPAGPQSDTVAFFPLYPVIARVFTCCMNGQWALVTLSHLAGLVATIFLYLWARRRYDAQVAFWSVLLLSAYPGALYFSTGYADGLLVMWVALALWLLEYRRPWLAALVCGLATATRPTGLALAAVVVLWVWLDGRRFPWPRQAARVLAIGLISISGLIAFQLYLWSYYDRPDAFVAVQSNWAKPRAADHPIAQTLLLKPVVPPAFDPLKYAIRLGYAAVTGDGDALRFNLERLGTPQRWNALWNVALLSVSIIGLLRPGPIPRVFFLLAILVFLEAWLPDPCWGARLVGIARYQLVALPAFLLLASWMVKRWPPMARLLLCAALLFLQCIYLRHYVDWRLVS